MTSTKDWATLLREKPAAYDLYFPLYFTAFYFDGYFQYKRGWCRFSCRH